MTKYVFFNKTESFIESVVKDFVTFAGQAFCIYISYLGGTTFWVFVTGSLFFGLTITKLLNELGMRQKVFDSRSDMIEYINTLEN